MSIKHSLEQMLHINSQQNGISKLLELKYKISNMRYVENEVVNALSRRSLFANSQP